MSTVDGTYGHIVQNDSIVYKRAKRTAILHSNEKQTWPYVVDGNVATNILLASLVRW